MSHLAARSAWRSALLAALALVLIGIGRQNLAVAANAARGAAGTVLTNAGQVLRLGREGAKTGKTADIEAVLTLPNWDRPTWLWVQDGTNAVFVVHTNRFERHAGVRVRVRGVTAPGDQVPVFINDAQVDVLGDGVMPEALRLPVAHLFRPEFSGRWIEQEGVVRSVDRQEGAYRIVMAADDAPVEALFYVGPGQPGPTDWLGRRLRMRGVCVTGFDAEGRVFGFMMHVPGTNQVTDMLRSNEPPPRPAPGQPRIAADSLAEALANLGPLTDPPQSPATLTNTLPVLTNVQQVLELGLDGARARPHPVRLIGVIIYPLPSNRSLYVDDGTGGIEVVYGYTDRLPERPPGMLVWIDGIAGTGPIRPWIAEARIKPLGTVPLPEAKRPPPAELASGRWHGQWIELEGVVRDLTRSGTLDLLVAVGGHHVEVVLPYSGRLRPPLEWLDARVSARGLCDVPVDYSGRPTQARLFLNDTNDLKIVRDGTTDTFGRASIPPAGYRAAPVPSDDRIKIEGRVLFHADDGRLYLHDGVGAVQAEPLSVLVRRSSRTVGIDRAPRERLTPGDRVELVGALASSGFAPRFLDAEFRRMGSGPAAEPLRVTAADASSGRHDAMLVTLRARVVGREVHPTPCGRQPGSAASRRGRDRL